MLLTDEEIGCISHDVVTNAHTLDYFARAVIAAYENKLREEKEPKGYLVYFRAKLGGANVTDRLFVWRKELATNQVNADLIQKVVPVFEHPAPIPAEQIAEIKRKERERCAALLENGRFLHDQAPTKLFATEAAKAIHALED